MFAGVVLCALLAGQEAALRPTLRPANYFPLQPGTTWVYQVSGVGGGVRHVTAAAGVSVASTSAAVLLDGYFPGAPRLVRSFAGKVEELGPGGEAYLWYLLAAPEGTSWTLRLAPMAQERMLPCTDGARVTLASRRETVTVPAGTFADVILVRWESPCRDAGIVAEWFAPEVGLVQREEAGFAGKIVWQLQEVRRDATPSLPRYGGALALSQRHYVLNLMPPVDPQHLPVLAGTLALWHWDPEPNGEGGVPLCLLAKGEILDERGQLVVAFVLPDPACFTLAPHGFAAFRLLPFSHPFWLGKKPLAQGSYTLRVSVETPGWKSSFSLPFSVSHVY